MGDSDEKAAEVYQGATKGVCDARVHLPCAFEDTGFTRYFDAVLRDNRE